MFWSISTEQVVAGARPLVGIGLLLLISLLSTLKLTKPTDQFLLRFAGVRELSVDRVTLYEKRFAPLRRVLPAYGRVGYVTDENTNDYMQYENFLIVRYILTPVLVENELGHALVVGNITQQATDLQRFLSRQGLTLVKDLGDGVLLLEKESQ